MSTEMTKTITFYYYEPSDIISFLVSCRFSSIFSHVGIGTEDHGYFDSTAFIGATFRENNIVPKLALPIEVPVEVYENIITFLKQIEGSSYDLLSVIGFLLGRKIQRESSWFCTEVGRVVFDMITGTVMKHYTLLSPGEHRIMVDAYLLGK